MTPTKDDMINLKQEAQLALTTSHSRVVVKATDLLALLEYVDELQDEVKDLYEEMDRRYDDAADYLTYD